MSHRIRRVVVGLAVGLGSFGLGAASGCAGEGRALAQDGDDAPQQRPRDEDGAALRLESPAFDDHGAIPRKYTCEGDDVAPALHWSGVPEQAEALALIVDDPDAPDPEAPRTTFVHWVVFDIPTVVPGLPEGGELPEGAREGVNDRGETGYIGPCPPIGRHRYFFKLYALDAQLDLDEPTKAELENAMEGHVLAEAELVGTYQKRKP